MANFMGPMAPPQAAPPQPQKLDIRTSPNQRQQFKDFMRQRTAMMPMTSAPVAPPPMMPQMPPQMPLRMEMGGDVDIFEPQNYHEGGLVNTLGQLATMSGQMQDAVSNLVLGEGAGGMGMTGGFGGPSLSGPGPLGSISPPPGADVSNFFSNLRGQLPNQGLKIADRSGTGINNPDPAPTLNSSKPDNTRLLGSGDNIDQGFLNSPEFKNLDFTGPATQDIYNSPYFGTVMSGSQGKAQDAAYEAYLERIGNKAPAGTPTAPMQPARNLFSGTVEPTSYGLAGMGTTFSFEDGGAVPPRNVDIKGQPHMLSYITPDEADILEALGGSGETGPMGIPSFPPSERDSLGRDTGQGREGGGGGGGADDRDGPDFGMSPGRSQAQFGTTEFAGKTEQEAKDELAGGGGSEQAKAVQDNLAAQAAAEAARVRAAEARARQDAINRARDRLEAGISATAGIGQRPDVNIGTRSQAEIDNENLAGLFGVDVQTPALTDEQLGISAVDTTQPDDLVESNRNLLGDDVLMDDLLDIQPTTTSTTVDPNQVNIGVGSTTPITDLTADPMAVAKGMDQVRQKGIADLSLIDAAADLITGIFGIGPDPEQIRSDYENRAYSTLGMSPGTAEAVLGTQTETGPVTGSIGGPRGFLGSLAFGPFSPGAAGMTGMTPDGVSTGAITGDQLFEAQDKGLFGDLTLGAASSSNVAVVDPNTGNIVGAIDGRGRYTGSPEFNPNTYGKELGPDAGGRDMPVVKSPTDPCPDGFALKDGVCTPIAPTGGSGSLGNIPTSPPPAPVSPVLVPSTRQTIPNTLQGPVGYGMPTAGQINPFAVSSAAQYQQMLNQQAMNPPQFAPIKFQDGGPVSPELDRAADNFLQSLMPAA